jgi:hypothetical protein
MTISPHLLVLIVAIVCFAVAALFRWVWPNETRFSFIALGLFFYALKDILT